MFSPLSLFQLEPSFYFLMNRVQHSATDIYTQHFISPPHVSIKSPPQNELTHVSNKSKPGGLFSLPSELQECNLLVWAVGFGIMLLIWAEVVPQLCANIVSALVALKVITVFRLSTTVAANAGCYMQIYLQCCLEMTKMNLDRFYTCPPSPVRYSVCIYIFILTLLVWKTIAIPSPADGYRLSH